MDAVQICASAAARPLSRLSDCMVDRGVRISDPPGRARTDVDVGRPREVGHRDHRGHGAPPIAERIEQLERPLETRETRMVVVHDRQGDEHLLEAAAGRDVTQDVVVLAGLKLLDEPGADPGDRDHAELPRRGRERAVSPSCSAIAAARANGSSAASKSDS